MYSISREYWFSAAHRLEGHPKCGRLHGHNYRVVVSIEGEVDPNGMVIDYGRLDDICKPLIELLDHRYIISRANIDAGDEYAELATEKGHAAILSITHSTAECLAKFLYNQIGAKFVEQDLALVVQVDETPKSSATYEPGI